jgi:hypothetical protein
VTLATDATTLAHELGDELDLSAVWRGNARQPRGRRGRRRGGSSGRGDSAGGGARRRGAGARRVAGGETGRGPGLHRGPADVVSMAIDQARCCGARR